MPNGRVFGRLSHSTPEEISAVHRTWMQLLWFSVVAILCSGTVRAHEIGTTHVSVVFQESGIYDVEVVTDATALAEKLDASSGLSLPPGIGPDRLLQVLTAFDDKFRRRVQLAFDGAEVRPEISYSVEPAMDAMSAIAATIHLTGTVPRDAHQFTWAYGWTFATYAITGSGSSQWLEGGEGSAPIPIRSPAPPPTRLSTAGRYLLLGFTHIVPYGLDHMLFVLGIYLLSRRARSVLLQVSAFTVAHSITLGLSMYGIVTVSPRIVEPMIALSIGYIAIENIFLSELKSRRIALVFAFGLLHGMGFAGALRELGLPRSEFVTALVTFNVGVEAGQLAVIGTAFLFVGWHCARQHWYRDRIVVPASALIAATAVYWTIQRISF